MNLRCLLFGHKWLVDHPNIKIATFRTCTKCNKTQTTEFNFITQKYSWQKKN